jgi:catechol 2,3-dioxygenase-like lactoylglutathione lyase family enzyme
MTGPTIEHIGILVPDLEEAIERWSRVLGYTFSPIARYRTCRYLDSSGESEHFHDARLAFSKEGPPRIELLEATGEGTHNRRFLGVHHFGFPGTADPEGRVQELAGIGIGVDGQSFSDDEQLLLFFTRPEAMDGVRLEYISPLPGRTVADDGSALPIDPDTGRHDLWAPRP